MLSWGSEVYGLCPEIGCLSKQRNIVSQVCTWVRDQKGQVFGEWLTIPLSEADLPRQREFSLWFIFIYVPSDLSILLQMEHLCFPGFQ